MYPVVKQAGISREVGFQELTRSQLKRRLSTDAGTVAI